MIVGGGGEFVEEIGYGPFLNLIVPIVRLLYMPRLHHDLRSGPIHIFLEACRLLAVLAGPKGEQRLHTCPRHDCGMSSLSLRICFLGGEEACCKSKA
jgi:hypothetical protein